MTSSVWTLVAEPFCTALPSPMDPSVETFRNTLFDAVHTDRGPILSHNDTSPAQTAEIARLQHRLSDEEIGSKLTDLLHAARFCQAHADFQVASMSLLGAAESQAFTEIQQHQMAVRMKYVGEQTLRIAADSRVLGPYSAGPTKSNP